MACRSALRRRVGRALLLSSWAGPLRALGRFVSNGIVAVVLFNTAMVIWHLPALFDFAERNQAVHIWLMHSSFFLTGVLFWLQIIPSYPIKPKLTTVEGHLGDPFHQCRDDHPGHVAEHLVVGLVVLGVRPLIGGPALPLRRSTDRSCHLVGVR